MRLEERLRALVDALPEGASVTLPARVLEEWLSGEPAHGKDAAADLTVAQVAALLGRSPQAVRNWIRTGDLKAYTFRNREYRVTRIALESFLDRQRSAGDNRRVGPKNTPTAPLGTWRGIRAKH